MTAENSEPDMTAAELQERWKEDLAVRDRAIQQRQDNMFLGPIGIEEAVSIANRNTGMAIWYIDKLIAVVAAQEERLKNHDR